MSPDGDIIRSGPVGGFEWGNPWEMIGEIALTDRLAGMCDPMKFSKFSYAMMVHAVSMISVGYGDDPCDVMTWFEGENFEFLEGIDFEFSGESGQFVGLEGERVHVLNRVSRDQSGLMAEIGVARSQFDIELVSDQDIVDFIIATIPV